MQIYSSPTEAEEATGLPKGALAKETRRAELDHFLHLELDDKDKIWMATHHYLKGESGPGWMIAYELNRKDRSIRTGRVAVLYAETLDECISNLAYKEWCRNKPKNIIHPEARPIPESANLASLEDYARTIKAIAKDIREVEIAALIKYRQR